MVSQWGWQTISLSSKSDKLPSGHGSFLRTAASWGKGRGQTGGISEEANDLVEQGSVQHMVPPAAFPYPGEGGKGPFPLLFRGLEEREISLLCLPPFLPFSFPFHWWAELEISLQRRHLLPQPWVLAPSVPDSLPRRGAGIQHLLVCKRPALPACLKCTDFKTVLKKIGKWEGEPINLKFLSFPAFPLQVIIIIMQVSPNWDLFNLTIEEQVPGKQSLPGTVLTHMFKGTNLHHSSLTWELLSHRGIFLALAAACAWTVLFPSWVLPHVNTKYVYFSDRLILARKGITINWEFVASVGKSEQRSHLQQAVCWMMQINTSGPTRAGQSCHCGGNMCWQSQINQMWMVAFATGQELLRKKSKSSTAQNIKSCQYLAAWQMAFSSDERDDLHIFVQNKVCGRWRLMDVETQLLQHNIGPESYQEQREL